MNKRILVIDDEKDICEVLSRNLSDCGYDITCELKGRDGIIQLRHSRFDAVILDLKLPDVNGVDLMKKIRRMNQEIPVIILTGYPCVDSAIATMRCQAVDYLRKPFNVAELKEVLNRAFDYKRNIPESRLINLKSIGEKIREIRKRKRWSLDILAARTGFSKSFLSEMERARRFPRLNTLQKIASVLEVDIQFFLAQ